MMVAFVMIFLSARRDRTTAPPQLSVRMLLVHTHAPAFVDSLVMVLSARTYPSALLIKMIAPWTLSVSIPSVHSSALATRAGLARVLTVLM